MKHFIWKHFIVVTALAIGAGTATAQQASNPPTNPVQTISNSAFQQLIAAGQAAPVTPGTLFAQDLRQAIADLEHRAIIQTYLRNNPNLTRLAALFELTPADPNVHQIAGGDYISQLVTPNGMTQIETNGPSTKWAQMADAIVTSSDPVRQLQLYGTLYSGYQNLYSQLCAPPTIGIANAVGVAPSGCANLVAPSALTDPATLQTAPLGVIESALTALGSQGFNVLHMIPLPAEVGPVPCNEQVGASSAAGVNGRFGDQTQSAGYTPSSSGIVGNFNFVNKDLLSCIKNQGQRGTCHIFAATSAVEEIIARDTGVYVNLSEQDFMEHLKLLWSPSFYGDGGDSGADLRQAENNGYQFAYENQWDYNPSLSRPYPQYVNVCLNYPYPSLEPACSETAPQSLEYCTAFTFQFFILTECALAPAPVSGGSPYSSAGAGSIWNPSNPDLSVDFIYLALAFNAAVPMCFNETANFQGGSPGGYIEYSAADNMTSKGGHCVHIVGFVSNADLAGNPNTASQPPGSGGGYFIIKNSWGAWFGDAGYVYMPVDYVKANASSVYSVSAVNE